MVSEMMSIALVYREVGLRQAGCVAFMEFVDKASTKMNLDFYLLPPPPNEILLLLDVGKVTVVNYSTW